ncbi:MAG: 50S ribosomal protein L13 [Desulfurococcales archaeon ex4484_58]|nr:MAG: 50S ribosomal protein L13 [Desulfurococcales archaeon ex4484_58]
MSREKILYVDATNQILGRLASIVAKKLLEGYRVYIVNAEKAVISGEKKRVIEGYKLLFKVTTHYNPYKSGIKRPRAPHNILKRTVRGMLPMDKPRGRNAYRRLRVYIGIPQEFKNREFIRFSEADASRLKREYIYLGDLAKELGWKGVVYE